MCVQQHYPAPAVRVQTQERYEVRAKPSRLLLHLARAFKPSYDVNVTRAYALYTHYVHAFTTEERALVAAGG